MKFISRFIEIVIDLKYFGSLVTLQKRFSNNFDIISDFVDFGVRLRKVVRSLSIECYLVGVDLNA